MHSGHWNKHKRYSGKVPEKPWGFLKKAPRVKGTSARVSSGLMQLRVHRAQRTIIYTSTSLFKKTNKQKTGRLATFIINSSKTSALPFPVPFPPLSTHCKRILITAIELFFAQIFSVSWNIIRTVRIYFWRVSPSPDSPSLLNSHARKSHLTLRTIFPVPSVPIITA